MPHITIKTSIKAVGTSLIYRVNVQIFVKKNVRERSKAITKY